MNVWLDKVLRNKHVRYGAPFFTFLFGGAFALKQFRSVRYDVDVNPAAKRFIKPEEAFGDTLRANNIELRNSYRDVPLEADVKELAKLDTENWENKRGPRPWEEGSILERKIVRAVKAVPTVAELTAPA